MSVKQEAVKRHVSSERIILRLLATVLASCLGLFLLFPWGNRFTPEINPFAGPLWLLKTQSPSDFQGGCCLVCILVPMIGAVGVRVNTITIVLCLVGVLLWLGIGIEIGSGAAL